ncbi:hypothetical protein HHL26_23535 [Sphingobium sp. TB-6]|uniref:cupin domain-containing protein n=1 Tax=Sphingobium sp. TB-6 TaxID=2728850 RepID=UPI000B24EF76|nr:hypothetical protein [Sphingobium sp. TB-6]NML91975.1 hypothetical protein [Sphingobium sp. TB-6]
MATMKHKDIFARDIEWIAGDEGVRFAQFLLDPNDAEESPAVILAKFEPGEEIHPHTHACNYLEYIVQGSQKVGKINFEAGDVRWAAAGTGYGPIKIGLEGCTVLIVFETASKSAPILLGKARGLAAAAQ